MKSKLLVLITLILLIIGNPSFSLSQSRRQSDEEARRRQQQEQIRRAQEERRRAQQEYQRQQQEQQRRAQQDAYRRQQEEQRRAQQEYQRRVQEEQRRAEQEAYRRQQEEQRRVQEEYRRRALEEQRRAEQEAYRRVQEEQRRAQQQKPIRPTQSATQRRVQEEQGRAQAEEQRRAQEALLRQQQEARRKAQQADDQERRKQALQQELVRKQRELAEAQKRQAQEQAYKKTQTPRTGWDVQQDAQRRTQEEAQRKAQLEQQKLLAEQQRQKQLQAIQEQLRVAKEKADAIQRQVGEKQRSAQQTAPQKLAQQAELQRQQKAIQQELARKQKELNELQQRQAREAAAKKQQAQQPVVTPAQKTNPDIQVLQKNTSIAQSGNFGRTPGGIVDLRTGQIVAPSVAPISGSPQLGTPPPLGQPPTINPSAISSVTNAPIGTPSPTITGGGSLSAISVGSTPTPMSNPDIQRLQRDLTIAQSGNFGRTPGGIVDLRTGQIVAPSVQKATPTTGKALVAPAISGPSSLTAPPSPGTLAGLSVTGGALPMHTAGMTPPAIGIPVPTSLPYGSTSTSTSRIPSSPPVNTTRPPLSAEEVAQMQRRLQSMQTILKDTPENTPPSPESTSSIFSRYGTGLKDRQYVWESGRQIQAVGRSELSKAEQALKSGDIEGYKRYLGNAQLAARTSSESFTAAASLNVEALNTQAEVIDKIRKGAFTSGEALGAYSGIPGAKEAFSLGRVASDGLITYFDQGGNAASKEVFKGLVAVGAGEVVGKYAANRGTAVVSSLQSSNSLFRRALGQTLKEIGEGPVGGLTRYGIEKLGESVTQKTLFGIETGRQP